VLEEEELNTLLDEHLRGLGKVQRNRVKEASAIAYYHQQSDCPIIKTLICDDAPQFKLLTEELSLCWVHEGRHYKKLNPLVGYHQKLLDQFLDDFWDYYRELLTYLEHPELPLHNNPAELAARTMVQRRNISYGTQTELGTKAWDTFMSLVDTTRKLGISFFEYVADRISETGNIPPLATIIEEKSSFNFWGESWQV
jgi:hypothetical protein